LPCCIRTIARAVSNATTATISKELGWTAADQAGDR
jgi:hypothetical protein